MKNIKLLIPHYMDEEVTSDLDEHYNNIKNISKKLGIEKNILFHKWVPYELMPEYYSLGNLTLSIGNFIEAFGSNIGLESLACGTPVIMSLVGAQRYTLPEGIFPRVAYDDLDEVVKISKKILLDKNAFDLKKMRNFIERNFSHNLMLKKYEKIIVSSKISKPLEIKFTELNIKKSKLIIAPWCYLTKFGIYSDYEYKYYKINGNLIKFLMENEKFYLKDIRNNKMKKEITKLYEGGVLVLVK